MEDKTEDILDELKKIHEDIKRTELYRHTNIPIEATVRLFPSVIERTIKEIEELRKKQSPPKSYSPLCTPSQNLLTDLKKRGEEAKKIIEKVLDKMERDRIFALSIPHRQKVIEGLKEFLKLKEKELNEMGKKRSKEDE